MLGKICLVADGVCDMGMVAGRRLAELGATVVLVGPAQPAGEAALAAVASAVPDARVRFLQGDLSSQADVRRLADEFMKRHRRLDVLINNACAYYRRRRTSLDNVDLTLAVNHLGPFLLTALLLDLCRASAPMRITSVVEMPREGVHLDLEALGHQDRYRADVSYTQARLALFLCTMEFARRTEGTGITVNVVDPGFGGPGVAGSRGLGRLSRRLANLVGDGPEEVAEAVVRVASDPELGNITGHVFVRGEPTVPPAARDAVTARRLWELSSAMVGTAIFA